VAPLSAARPAGNPARRLRLDTFPRFQYGFFANKTTGIEDGPIEVLMEKTAKTPAPRLREGETLHGFVVRRV